MNLTPIRFQALHLTVNTDHQSRKPFAKAELMPANHGDVLPMGAITLNGKTVVESDPMVARASHALASGDFPKHPELVEILLKGIVKQVVQRLPKTNAEQREAISDLASFGWFAPPKSAEGMAVVLREKPYYPGL